MMRDSTQLNGWNPSWERSKLFEALIILLTILCLVRRAVWMPSFVVGQSMLPTVQPGAIVGVNKLAYCRCPPQRGDIVLVFTGKELLVKRIIGLPGDEISVMKGFVYINGKALEEPYLHSRDEALTIGTAKLAGDQFVIAGDNRRESLIALVNRERIVGRLTGY